MATVQNELIKRLPRAERTRLLALCAEVPLVLSEMLYVPGVGSRHAYFPLNGFVSLVSAIDGRAGVEVGMVGREGMVGAHLILGVATAPLHALVQGAGSALRISASALKKELAINPVLHRELSRYLYVLMSQLATSAACLRFHQIGPRLARWLLMSEDRARSKSFHVTQEFLAYMLGVRRVGITAAAGALQSAGLIEYYRGELTVVDRAGLEAAACSCYRVDTDGYKKLF